MTTRQPALLAIDVGNSKTDVALVATDGSVLGAVRGPTASHQAAGFDGAMAVLDALIERVVHEAGGTPWTAPGDRPLADLLVYCGAGVDFPDDQRLLGRALRARGYAERDIVLNDTFAALRAGSSRSWGVAVICGAGVNCVGRGPDGRTVRFPALGWISGDRGGGSAVGRQGLSAAIRGRDGRGPRTSLERLVPEALGFRRPIDVTRALYDGRLDERVVGDLAPVVFRAAGEGDAVARGIVDELADELATWAIATIRRLGLARADPDVVLAGGVFRTEDAAFYGRLAGRIRAVAPRAVVGRLLAPPVVGSALIGLDALQPPDPAGAEARLRAGLTDMRLGAARELGPAG